VVEKVVGDESGDYELTCLKGGENEGDWFAQAGVMNQQVVTFVKRAICN